ncbi:hypothetical protein BDN72DRAFT_897950 [Pluteus cervinus]|uniref:Uncharacterized protein n=1 Tax=Pluteus cervinus TaxID=181527 RepID=A0ACD3ASV7_9AGAR|nr:hypothetical protein BDN72DRAFT_897950 [Pluteus cervinus]
MENPSNQVPNPEGLQAPPVEGASPLNQVPSAESSQGPGGASNQNQTSHFNLTSLTASLPRHDQGPQDQPGFGAGSHFTDIPSPPTPSTYSTPAGSLTSTEISRETQRPANNIPLPPLPLSGHSHSNQQPGHSGEDDRGQLVGALEISDGAGSRGTSTGSPLEIHARPVRTSRFFQGVQRRQGGGNDRSNDHTAWDADDEGDDRQDNGAIFRDMESIIEGILQRRLGPLEGAIADMRSTVSTSMRAMSAAQGPMYPPGQRQQGGQDRTPKLTTGPIHRPAAVNRKACTVRKHLLALLGPNPQLPSPRELLTFSQRWNVDGGATAGPCCTAQSFKIDIRGTPHSPWNQSAARVFTAHLIQSRNLPNTYQNWEQLTKAFFTRVKSLRDQANKRQPVNAKAARRAQRKRNLFYRRLDIANKLPFLQYHVNILERLGVNGMSSDESGSEDQPAGNQGPRLPVYHILFPQWRAPNISAFLHVIDSAHVTERMVSTDAAMSPGAIPRIREIDFTAPRYSTKRNNFVPDLPLNAYRQEWLATRVDLALSVRPRDEHYEFRHDNAVVDYIRSAARRI